MKVLIACEYSGIVRDAFSKAGADAWSCDLLPTESELTRQEGKHYQCDIFDVLYQDWDLMIAHPPCTCLANSGVSWLHKDADRWIKLFEASDFFIALLNANIRMICIENPIQHKYAKRLISKNPSQIIQPYMFGHPEQKATCLWLKNLPLLQETNNVKKQMLELPKNERQRLHYLPPKKDMAKIRSKTFQGIANAMAEQWTEYIIKEQFNNQ